MLLSEDPPDNVHRRARRCLVEEPNNTL